VPIPDKDYPEDRVGRNTPLGVAAAAGA